MTRYDPTRPEFGSLLTSEEVKGNIHALDRANDCRPLPGSEGNSIEPMRIWIEAGNYAVESTSTTKFVGDFCPGLIAPDFSTLVSTIVNPGDSIQVLIYFTLVGNLIYRAENINNPISAYPSDILPIAEITLTYGMTVIEEADIIDVRPVIMSSSAGMGINPQVESFFNSIPGQTDFILTTFAFANGEHEILVFVDGKMQTEYDGVDGDYEEIGQTTIHLRNGCIGGETVTIYRVGYASSHFLTDLDDVTVNLSEAFRDINSLRSAADVLNPLATMKDISNSFSVEHYIDTTDPSNASYSNYGQHGPHVTITQPNDDTALLVLKSGTGSSPAVGISNGTDSPALHLVQTGNPGSGACNIETSGIGNAFKINQAANGYAIDIQQTVGTLGLNMKYDVSGLSNIAFKIARTATAGGAPFINLSDEEYTTGVNLSISNDNFTFADEATNTEKFKFNVITAELSIFGGGNNNYLTITKTATGIGHCIEISNSGRGDGILVTNIGNDAGSNGLEINNGSTVGRGILINNSSGVSAIEINNAGLGNGICIDGTTIDPLWGGPASNCDSLHTHTPLLYLSDLQDISVDESLAFNDPDGLRTSSANRNNPFATLNILPAGTILPFGGQSTPSGFKKCDGSAISRTTYVRLFTAIGTTWGAGDGSTTFNVPDLRGTFLRGIGTHGTGTKSNGGSYSGPTLGSSDNDQMQGFEIAEDYRTGTLASAANNNTFVMDDNRGSAGSTAFVPKTDGVNGTPRTGDETKPFNAGVNFIIKL